MAPQAGKDLLLKLDDGLGAFITVAGLRTRQLTFNADSVDITSQESSGRWRELLAGAGIRRAGVSGSGVFRDETSDAQMRQVFFDGVIRNWQIIVPSFGIVQGAFLITALDYKGDYAGGVTFDVSLESAGALSFTVI